MHKTCGAKAHVQPLFFVLALIAPATIQAQTVYRCESGGRVVYSHEPCVGAKAVDTTPTQGLDKSTGISRKGRDVRRDELKRRLNEAMYPLTGMSHEETSVFERRMRLTASEQAMCKVLDLRLPDEEKDALSGNPADKADAEMRLYQSRKRYRDLRC